MSIKTSETETAFMITVTDNGEGFDTKTAATDDGRSHVGIENTRSRLAALCSGMLEIDSVPGQGTTAIVSIPKGDNHG